MYVFDISHFANKWKRDCIFLSIVDVFAGVSQFFSLWPLSRFVTKLFIYRAAWPYAFWRSNPIQDSKVVHLPHETDSWILRFFERVLEPINILHVGVSFTQLTFDQNLPMFPARISTEAGLLTSGSFHVSVISICHWRRVSLGCANSTNLILRHLKICLEEDIVNIFLIIVPTFCLWWWSWNIYEVNERWRHEQAADGLFWILVSLDIDTPTVNFIVT